MARLPIVEYLFQWRGIGQLALGSVGVHDAPGFVFSTVVLAALFTTLSAIADLPRPRAPYLGGLILSGGPRVSMPSRVTKAS